MKPSCETFGRYVSASQKVVMVTMYDAYSRWYQLCVVVVLTFTHRHYTMQSVVVGQAPITPEWKKYLGRKTEAEKKTVSVSRTSWPG